jgi:hypothetical protein
MCCKPAQNKDGVSFLQAKGELWQSTSLVRGFHTCLNDVPSYVGLFAVLGALML